MSYYREPDSRREAAILFLIVFLALTFARHTRADVITEFGAGVKLPSTSYLLMPECSQAIVIEPEYPANPRGLTHSYSCGGDNPAFTGWPIAYEWESASEIWRVRVGWFHYSNWFDGGPDRETHMDCACVTATFNWSARRRSR